MVTLQAAALEVGASLSQAQLAGHSALPDPLPLLPDLAERMESAGAELEPADRALLLAAAICTEDRTKAHALMQHAYVGLGRHGKAVWHQSLATLEGDQELVPALLSLSRRAEQVGSLVWAHANAREAASHAVGPDEFECRLASGTAALKLGLVADAAAWLGPVLDAPELELAASALPLFIHAEALLTGEVPTMLLDRRSAAVLQAATSLDEAATSRVVLRVAKALGLSAGLCAARGWCTLFGVPVVAAPHECRCQ